jgi:hypothetical protein
MRSVTWRTLHNTSIVIIVISTVIHALLIQGTMGAVSKLVLCVAVLVAMTVALVDLRIFKPILKSRVGQKPKPKPLS